MRVIVLAVLALAASAHAATPTEQWEARAKESPARLVRLAERGRAARTEEERMALSFIASFEQSIAIQATDRKEALRLHGGAGDTFEVTLRVQGGKDSLQIGYLYDRSGALLGAQVEHLPQVPNPWLVMFLKSLDTSKAMIIRGPDGFMFVFLRDMPFFLTVHTPSGQTVVSEG